MRCSLALCVGILSFASAGAASTPVNAAHRPGAQVVLSSDDSIAKSIEPDNDMWAAEEGVGHFSEWSKSQKRKFIDVVRSGNEAAIANWTIVMGNEGGDLDSMTSALTWAYHLDHIHKPDTHDHSQTVALLQTPEDALDLRPENKLALSNAKMSPGHRDLLTIDELPLPAEDLAKKVKGIIIVDHPVPLSVWAAANVVSVFDHHTDRGVAPGANPRLFQRTASCSTLVAKTMLDEWEKMEKGHRYHLPHELLELILSAIALDSDALSPVNTSPDDVHTAARLLALSRWNGKKLQKVMDDLDDQMGTAKKALDDLSVRDLLRRDWKGDVVETPEGMPNIHLGFASIPISIEDQIERTLHQRVASWFDIESQWTDEINADASIALTSFKVKDAETGKKVKKRQIVLVVRSDKNINEEQADSLFAQIKKAIDESTVLDAEPWERSSELQGRQMVWTHSVAAGGRKLVRPLVEGAVKTWSL